MTYHHSRKRAFYLSDLAFPVIGVLVAALVIVAAVVGIWGATNHHTRYDCVVTGKDRTSKPKGGSDMRVYTSNCGNFTVEDSMLNGNYHSSDTYASIQTGHAYNFDTVGWRLPFFSMFPNILNATEVH